MLNDIVKGEDVYTVTSAIAYKQSAETYIGCQVYCREEDAKKGLAAWLWNDFRNNVSDSDNLDETVPADWGLADVLEFINKYDDSACEFEASSEEYPDEDAIIVYFDVIDSVSVLYKINETPLIC